VADFLRALFAFYHIIFIQRMSKTMVLEFSYNLEKVFYFVHQHNLSLSGLD